jgi:peptide deformylase
MDEIRIYPDPILIKKAAKVQNIDGQVKGIVDRMTEAMHFHRGIG